MRGRDLLAAALAAALLLLLSLQADAMFVVSAPCTPCGDPRRPGGRGGAEAGPDRLGRAHSWAAGRLCPPRASCCMWAARGGGRRGLRSRPWGEGRDGAGALGGWGGAKSRALRQISKRSSCSRASSQRSLQPAYPLVSDVSLIFSPPFFLFPSSTSSRSLPGRAASRGTQQRLPCCHPLPRADRKGRPQNHLPAGRQVQVCGRL